MNMNLFKKKNLPDIEKELNSLIDLTDPKEKEEFDQVAFQLDLMHEVRQLMKLKGWKQNDLALKLGKSKSYISQLFSGDKLINIKTIIKLQNIFEIKFSVSVFSVYDPKIQLIETINDLIDTIEYYFTGSQLSELVLPKQNENQNLTSPLHSETCFVNEEGYLINKTQTILESDSYANRV